jgi:hypothetical protein
MQVSIHPRRLTRLRRARLLTLGTLVGGVLAAGCGASSHSAATATIAGAGTHGSSAATHSNATSSSSTVPGDYGSGALAFARCMRANGVPNFPDPSPGGGALFNAAGINPSAPAAREATAKCQPLLPRKDFHAGGPLPAPGQSTHPSPQTIVKLLEIADCMRQHGVPEFPDPRSSVPPSPFGSGTGVITDYDGAILLFPSTLDTQAPAYKRAAGACGTLARKLGSGPHG